MSVHEIYLIILEKKRRSRRHTWKFAVTASIACTSLACVSVVHVVVYLAPISICNLAWRREEGVHISIYHRLKGGSAIAYVDYPWSNEYLRALIMPRDALYHHHPYPPPADSSKNKKKKKLPSFDFFFFFSISTLYYVIPMYMFSSIRNAMDRLRGILLIY